MALDGRCAGYRSAADARRETTLPGCCPDELWLELCSLVSWSVNFECPGYSANEPLEYR